MGYSTDFYGRFEVAPQLDGYMIDYLNKFSTIRHMRRDVEKIKEIYPDWQQRCPGGELGFEGEYFISNTENYGQDHEDSVIDYNSQPSTQPGLWCQWIPSQDGCGIEWDGGEKFYEYTEWLKYLIYNFLEPNGYVVNGTVEWSGEDSSDIGKIIVEDNQVREVYGEIVFNDEKEDAGNDYGFGGIRVAGRG